MKKLFSILALVILYAGIAHAQWTYQGGFPDETSLRGGGNAAHGLAVSPDGRVWIQFYDATDSSLQGNGTWLKHRVIYVLNPDGTPAPFSPIKYVTVAGVTDTLKGSGRGLTTDHQGNVIISSGDIVYRVKYQDGTGMNKVAPVSPNSLDACAVDAEGNLYTSQVLGGFPVKEYAADFSFIGNAVDTLKDIGRTGAVTADGLQLIMPRFASKLTYVYNRPDKFSPFVQSTDTMAYYGLCIESMTWSANKKVLWVSSGSYNDIPKDTSVFKVNTWYGLNPKTGAIIDQIPWMLNVPGNANERPRAIAFAPDGKTAYVAVFGSNAFAPIQKYTNPNPPSAVGREELTSKTYALEQNYPNPFNPSTEIKFSVAMDGNVSLKVYDVVGNEIATLANGYMQKGTYTTNFDARNLATGTYFYRLNANGVSISKKMMFVK